MKTDRTLLGLLTALCLASACDDRFEERYDSLFWTDAEGASHSYMTTGYELGWEEGTLPLTVYYSGRWTAALSDGDGWASVDTPSGNGVGWLHISYRNNRNGKERTATVAISCANGERVDITLRQKEGPIDPVYPETIALPEHEVALDLGERRVLVPAFTPANANQTAVEWVSRDPGVVTVDENGTLLGVGEGTTYVKVETLSGGLKDSCLVTVTMPEFHPLDGDYWFSPDGLGNGADAAHAGGPALLRVLLSQLPAADGRTLHFAAGTYPMEATLTGSCTVTLQGAEDGGTRFQGAAFTLDGPDATFLDITFQDGRSEHAGGAVSVQSGAVHFSACRFEGNEAQEGGGAVQVRGEDASATFHRCTFRSNKAAYGADINVTGDASVFISRCSFYGGYISQKTTGIYPGRSLNAESDAEGGSGATTLCVHNSSFGGSSGAFTQNGGLPIVTASGAHLVVSLSTIAESGVALIRGAKRGSVNVDDFHVYGNLLLNSATVNSKPGNGINLATGKTRNGWCNVIGSGKNAYATLDETDNPLFYSDFDLAWDEASGLFTWQLKEGKALTSLPAAETLAAKVAASFPAFDTWLRSVDDTPYGIDQAGTSRPAADMTPGAWEAVRD